MPCPTAFHRVAQRLRKLTGLLNDAGVITGGAFTKKHVKRNLSDELALLGVKSSIAWSDRKKDEEGNWKKKCLQMVSTTWLFHAVLPKEDAPCSCSRHEAQEAGFFPFSRGTRPDDGPTQVAKHHVASDDPPKPSPEPVDAERRLRRRTSKKGRLLDGEDRRRWTKTVHLWFQERETKPRGSERTLSSLGF